jgi:hypothetical protein
MIGNEAAPYFLWKLPPNGLWKPLEFVMAHAVGTDSRLYVLDTNHALKTPALGPSKWATLAKDVRSFVVDNDGNLIVLGANGDLRTLNAKTKKWSATEPRVSSLMISPLGKVYTVTNGKDLRAKTAAGRWTVIDRGVRDFGMVDDGTIYALNGLGQLVKIAPNGRSRVLASGIQNLQVAPDGGVHVLTLKQELMKLTARDHWTVLDKDVRTFQIAENGDVYLINVQDELRRQKAGSVWSILQSNVVSFVIHSDGTVYAYDRQQIPTLYASLGRTVVLNPLQPGIPLQSDPPTESDIRRAANLPRFVDEYQSPENDNENIDKPWLDSDFINTDALPLVLAPQSAHISPRLRYSSATYPDPQLTVAYGFAIQTDVILNQLEPARFVPGLGPAQLHRAQFKSTITWTADDGTENTRMIYIDRDHYHTVY